jgi:uncharacterized membrane protein YoaK (UPF0700 family)
MLLTAVAGYTNAVCLLSLLHLPVSHMSGILTQVGVDLSAGDWRHIGLIGAMVASFLMGAVTSGLLIGPSGLRLGRRYGYALVIEAGLLLLASRGGMAGLCWATAACGLQNGMAGHYRGLVVRTTHMTGIVTDLGTLLGHRLRHAARHHTRRLLAHHRHGRLAEAHELGSAWKALFLFTLLLGFTVGGIAGANAGLQHGSSALLPVATLLAAAGMGHLAWCHSRRRTDGA